MTDLSAGGLRSRTDLETRRGSEPRSAGGVGTDPADRLARAKLDDIAPNSRQAREAVLGSESPCGCRTQSNGEGKAGPAET